MGKEGFWASSVRNWKELKGLESGKHGASFEAIDENLGLDLENFRVKLILFFRVKFHCMYSCFILSFDCDLLKAECAWKKSSCNLGLVTP